MSWSQATQMDTSCPVKPNTSTRTQSPRGRAAWGLVLQEGRTDKLEMDFWKADEGAVEMVCCMENHSWSLSQEDNSNHNAIPIRCSQQGRPEALQAVSRGGGQLWSVCVRRCCGLLFPPRKLEMDTSNVFRPRALPDAGGPGWCALPVLFLWRWCSRVTVRNFCKGKGLPNTRKQTNKNRGRNVQNHHL
jgi:hypothetical protein